MNEKQLSKLQKTLGEETVSELDSLDAESLKKVVVEASTAIKQAKDELEANPKYIEIKAQAKAASAGFNDVKKRQNAKIQYALELLENKGQ